MLSAIKAVMFSGIVEALKPIHQIKERDGVLEIQIERPSDFQDIKIGDSIAVNGICLTIESFDEKSMQFAIGHETKKIASWSEKSLVGKNCNLERSMRLGDRIHGHLMSGHVEGLGKITSMEKIGENLLLKIQIPEALLPFVWKKGGICMEGVSLTINEVEEDQISIGLVPETLRQTNLKELRIGDRVNLEADYLAKAIHRFWELENASN